MATDKKLRADPLDILTDNNAFSEEASNKNENLEMLNQLVDQNYSTKDIDVKTDLNDRQVMAFSKAQVFADKYENDLVGSLIHHIMKKSLSKGRQSRKEMQELGKSLLGSQVQETKDKSIREKLFG